MVQVLEDYAGLESGSVSRYFRLAVRKPTRVRSFLSLAAAAPRCEPANRSLIQTRAIFAG
jgi:hypothetical protein